jgi:hypothetical protein
MARGSAFGMIWLRLRWTPERWCRLPTPNPRARVTTSCFRAKRCHLVRVRCWLDSKNRPVPDRLLPCKPQQCVDRRRAPLAVKDDRIHVELDQTASVLFRKCRDCLDLRHKHVSLCIG